VAGADGGWVAVGEGAAMGVADARGVRVALGAGGTHPMSSVERTMRARSESLLFIAYLLDGEEGIVWLYKHRRRHVKPLRQRPNLPCEVD